MSSRAAVMSQPEDIVYNRHESSQYLWAMSPSGTAPRDWQERNFRTKMESLEHHASMLTTIALTDECSLSWLNVVAGKENLTFPNVTTLVLNLKEICRREKYVRQIKQILGRPDAFPNLRRLALSCFWFSNDDILELSHLQPVIQVELLSFWGNEASDFRPLWATTDRSNLLLLGLGNNRAGDSMLLQVSEAMASKKFPRLKWLDIEGVWYARPGREAFAEALRSGACPCLESIDISTVNQTDVPLLTDLDDDLQSLCQELKIEIDLAHGTQYKSNYSYGVYPGELKKEIVQDGEEADCMICLDQYKVGQKVLVTACDHRFHEKCLGKRLGDCRKRDRTPHCPACRRVFRCPPN